jgi:hypothetical protein
LLQPETLAKLKRKQVLKIVIANKQAVCFFSMTRAVSQFSFALNIRIV